MKPVLPRLTLSALVTLAGLSLPLAASGGGAGSGSGSGSGGATDLKAPSPLDHVRELLAAHQWSAAQTELRVLNATRDPDWNNLMGYVSRMKMPPDLAAAETYYAAALAINPKHRPTLEYLGELRLQQGNLPAAEEMLARLRKTTVFRSEEFKDLEKAIARYKAAGNTWVPET
jgi:hypothetical protein